jgi:hypothetical protein
LALSSVIDLKRIVAISSPSFKTKIKTYKKSIPKPPRDQRLPKAAQCTFTHHSCWVAFRKVCSFASSLMLFSESKEKQIHGPVHHLLPAVSALCFSSLVLFVKGDAYL